jgi:hypothetical protein
MLGWLRCVVSSFCLQRIQLTNTVLWFNSGSCCYLWLLELWPYERHPLLQTSLQRTGIVAKQTDIVAIQTYCIVSCPTVYFTTTDTIRSVSLHQCSYQSQACTVVMITFDTQTHILVILPKVQVPVGDTSLDNNAATTTNLLIAY